MEKPHPLTIIITWIIAITFALVPLFFLPLTQNFYETNKLMLLVISSLVVLLLWTLKIAGTRRIKFSYSAQSLSFVPLVLAGILSLIFSSVNKTEAIIQPIGVLLFASLGILIFISHAVFNSKLKTIIRWSLFGSAGLLSLATIYMFFGIGKLMFPDALFLDSPLWTPAGFSIAHLSFLVIVLPLLVDEIRRHKSHKNDIYLSLAVVGTLIVVAAMGLTLFRLVPGLRSVFLPYSASWSILLEMYKLPKFTLFGVGADNYLSAFTTARPAVLNLTPIWNIRFFLASSTLFHIATTLGILGLLGTVFVIRNLITAVKGHKLSGFHISVLLSILILTLLPPHLVTICAVAGLFLFIKPKEKTYINLKIPDHVSWVAVSMPIVALVIATGSFYGLYRYYAGELTFFQSLKAFQGNDGIETYNLQIKAITTNPYITNYHLAYAQTNMALANAIASNVSTATNSGQTAQLSEEDRTRISTLIQQAIREAKMATQLAPNNILSWEVLARTYQNIMGVVTGADQWAIAAYQRAIQLDPTNPILRISYASVFLALQDFDNALPPLLDAVNLKPDHANVHYNLAFVYRQRKEYFNEARALLQTLSLVLQGSVEAERVNQELEQAKEKLSEEELTALKTGTLPERPPQQQPLTQPRTEPEPQITPKLELPEEASAPAVPERQVSPTPPYPTPESP